MDHSKKSEIETLLNFGKKYTTVTDQKCEIILKRIESTDAIEHNKGVRHLEKMRLACIKNIDEYYTFYKDEYQRSKYFFFAFAWPTAFITMYHSYCIDRQAQPDVPAFKDCAAVFSFVGGFAVALDIGLRIYFKNELKNRKQLENVSFINNK